MNIFIFLIFFITILFSIKIFIRFLNFLIFLLLLYFSNALRFNYDISKICLNISRQKLKEILSLLTLKRFNKKLSLFFFILTFIIKL